MSFETPEAHGHPMLLVGPTLALRPPRAEDAEALFALGRDAEVTRWFSWGPYTSIEQPRAWIAEQEQRRATGAALTLAVLHGDDGIVGVTELTDWHVRDRRAVVGTWFARRWWGSGRNAESKALVAELAFAHCGLERLGAYADVGNARSRAALVKAGFEEEGVLRGWNRHGSEQKSVASFSLLRSEWTPGVRARLEGEVPPAFRV